MPELALKAQLSKLQKEENCEVSVKKVNLFSFFHSSVSLPLHTQADVHVSSVPPRGYP